MHVFAPAGLQGSPSPATGTHAPVVLQVKPETQSALLVHLVTHALAAHANGAQSRGVSPQPPFPSHDERCVSVPPAQLAVPHAVLAVG